MLLLPHWSKVMAAIILMVMWTSNIALDEEWGCWAKGGRVVNKGWESQMRKKLTYIHTYIYMTYIYILYI
jgi:hypothetical protein